MILNRVSFDGLHLKGPREDSGFSSDVNPGLQLVERIYNYCAKYHSKTKVMVSGIRQKQGRLVL